MSIAPCERTCFWKQIVAVDLDLYTKYIVLFQEFINATGNNDFCSIMKVSL
jgi:hypothetical protein